MMAHLLPAGADTAAPTVTWLRPGDGATVNAADPVEIEVEAVDERGDVREVRLSIGGQLVQRKVSFPFQMRWYPSAADVGRTVTLVVEAEDKAGNVTTSTRTITVGTAQSVEEAPLPTGVTTIAGRPVVGRTLTCIPSGFSGNGVRLSYQWLRNGAAIAGATGATYVPVGGRHRPRRELPRDGDQQRRQRGLDVRGADRLGGVQAEGGPHHDQDHLQAHEEEGRRVRRASGTTAGG